MAPENAEQCAAALLQCAERKLTVAPVGGGTKMGWGNPLRADVLLQTRAMCGVREHSWQDMTAIVDAGTPWAEMQQVLAQHGQQVALDPLWPERATVGGVVATNDSGSLRLKYGPLRDLIIGMTVVLADGTVARSGGKVVKNVAGYDLHKLMTGALGTLALITQVTFRLHPVERCVETWTLRSDSAEVLGKLLLRVLDSTLTPSGMQMRLDSPRPGSLSGHNGYALDVRFASLPEGLAASAARLQLLGESLACERAEESVWAARERLFVDDAWTLKVSMLPDKLAAVVGGFAQASALGVAAECVAEAAGMATVALRGDVVRVLELLLDLRARLAPSGGAAVVLAAPKEFEATDVAKNLDRWGGAPAAIALMREVKRQFDPGRMLNPGRFVGGI
jgi:glycolate oxidase FAD binding subunit